MFLFPYGVLHAVFLFLLVVLLEQFLFSLGVLLTPSCVCIMAKQCGLCDWTVWSTWTEFARKGCNAAYRCIEHSTAWLYPYPPTPVPVLPKVFHLS